MNDVTTNGGFPTRREIRARELQLRLLNAPFRGFPPKRHRRGRRGLDTFISQVPCEREGCPEPVGIVSIGQRKRFHAKSCRALRHNSKA